MINCRVIAETITHMTEEMTDFIGGEKIIAIMLIKVREKKQMKIEVIRVESYPHRLNTVLLRRDILTDVNTYYTRDTLANVSTYQFVWRNC